MSSESTKVNEYARYTPQTSRRNLDSTVNTTTTTTSESTEKADNPIFTIFFILAQIGGFYSFLKLVFSSVLAFFIHNIQVAEFINTIKYARLTSGKGEFFPLKSIGKSSHLMTSGDNKGKSIKEEIKIDSMFLFKYFYFQLDLV